MCSARAYGGDFHAQSFASQPSEGSAYMVRRHSGGLHVSSLRRKNNSIVCSDIKRRLLAHRHSSVISEYGTTS